MRERAAALLKIAEGQSGRQVAHHGLLKPRGPDTVYEWCTRYKRDGLAGLIVKPGRGRKPAWSPQYPEREQAREALLQVVKRDPRQFDADQSRWTLAAIQRACRWLRARTLGGVSHILSALQIRYKRARGHVHSPDGNYVAKLADIQVCVRRSETQPEVFVVLFEDECTYYRQPSLARAYAPQGHRQPLAELGYRHNAHTRGIATLDAWSGRVLYAQYNRMDVKHLVQFYQQVCAAYPQARTIYLVQDNWPVQGHPDVLAALQAQPARWPWPRPRSWPSEASAHAQRLDLPIQLVQLPTYASWTNPIEKLWRKLRQDLLHIHRYQDDWAGLKQRVSDWMGQWAQGSRDLLRYVGLQDPKRLYQAFEYVIGNSIKYTPDGGAISIGVYLLDALADVDRFVEVRVADTGIGIATDDLPHIFEKFYSKTEIAKHSSGRTKFKGGGSGLGLVVVRGIVEAHGGKVVIESPGYDEEKLPGTTVRILLPARYDPPASIGQQRLASLEEDFNSE